MVITPDRCDELRREWIARHAGISTIQKRRAEVLNRRIRDRIRRTAGARPNPHDDNVIHPLLIRRTSSLDGTLELAVVLAALALAPIGWALGHLMYHWICSYIPQRLRSYPIPAPLWASIALGVLTVIFYRPGDDIGISLAAPWLVAQIPATFLSAGLYGILNGWLAVPGSADWWPMAPPPTPVDLDIPMGPDDLTPPGLFDQVDTTTGEEHTPASGACSVECRGSTAPILAALILAAVGIVWTVAMVALGLKSALATVLV